MHVATNHKFVHKKYLTWNDACSPSIHLLPLQLSPLLREQISLDLLQIIKNNNKTKHTERIFPPLYEGMNADLGKYLLEYQMLSNLSREANIVNLQARSTLCVVV